MLRGNFLIGIGFKGLRFKEGDGIKDDIDTFASGDLMDNFRKLRSLFIVDYVVGTKSMILRVRN